MGGGVRAKNLAPESFLRTQHYTFILIDEWNAAGVSWFHQQNLATVVVDTPIPRSIWNRRLELPYPRTITVGVNRVATGGAGSRLITSITGIEHSTGVRKTEILDTGTVTATTAVESKTVWRRIDFFFVLLGSTLGGTGGTDQACWGIRWVPATDLTHARQVIFGMPIEGFIGNEAKRDTTAGLAGYKPSDDIIQCYSAYVSLAGSFSYAFLSTAATDIDNVFRWKSAEKGLALVQNVGLNSGIAIELLLIDKS